MNAYNNKIAIIVPTKDNPDDLRKLLASLATQTYPPDQLVVVDGSDPDIKSVLAEFTQLAIDYIRVMPPGLTKQRNAGIRAVRSDITLAGFLDDDIVVEKDALKQLMSYWASAPSDVGGTSFNITNNVESPCNLYTRLFRINEGRGGAILKSGISVILHPVLKDTQVDWLCGGATIWRKEILDQYKYDEWFLGCAFPEDMDFSFRVGKKYKLYVIEKARLQHYQKPIAINKNYQMVRSVVLSRYHIITKYPEYFSRPLFFYAIFGQTLNNLIVGFLTFNKVRLLRAAGNIAGIINIVLGKANSQKRDFAK